MQIHVLFETNDFLVVNKPPGLVVHPFDHSNEATLLDLLHAHDATIFSIHNEKKLMDGRIINLGGMVHKLDRDTSGVMVIAKNKTTFEELSQQFKNHQITKTYLALLEGVIHDDHIIIDALLGRNRKDYKQTAYPKNLRGALRDALTDLEVIKRSPTTTLVRLSPKTGRTHQLRAHMAHIGHPIVGDKAYGSTIDSPRIMLHAQQLSFSLLGEDYTFEASSPFTLETIK